MQSIALPGSGQPTGALGCKKARPCWENGQERTNEIAHLPHKPRNLRLIPESTSSCSLTSTQALCTGTHVYIHIVIFLKNIKNIFPASCHCESKAKEHTMSLLPVTSLQKTVSHRQDGSVHCTTLTKPGLDIP